METEKPYLVVLGPKCKALSHITNLNWDKLDPEKARRIQVKGMCMLRFSMQVAEFQVSHGGKFLHEHPAGASSWKMHAVKYVLSFLGVVRYNVDQCMLGLQVHPDGLSKKRTGLMSNDAYLLRRLRPFQCDSSHGSRSVGRRHLDA